jgi:hypothetical protein
LHRLFSGAIPFVERAPEQTRFEPLNYIRHYAYLILLNNCGRYKSTKIKFKRLKTEKEGQKRLPFLWVPSIFAYCTAASAQVRLPVWSRASRHTALPFAGLPVKGPRNCKSTASRNPDAVHADHLGTNSTVTSQVRNPALA